MLSVFSSLYAGNLMYYSSLLKAEKATIDLYENFQKQSFRNRCCIACPNGILNLIIPVCRKSKSIIKDVKIDNNLLKLLFRYNLNNFTTPKYTIIMPSRASK